MIWKSQANEKSLIGDMQDSDVLAAISVSQSRTVNLGILLNRYKSLSNKVKLYQYCLANKINLQQFVKEFRNKAVSTHGTSSVATDKVGYDFSLSFNQLRRLEEAELDVKLIQSNDCLHKLPYNVDASTWKYGFIPIIDAEGFTEKEYWVLCSIDKDASKLTLEQCSLILRVTSFWISFIEEQFNSWLIRSKKLIEEGVRRSLEITELSEYARFANQKIYVMV